MNARTTWLVANWKMNGSRTTVREFAYSVNAALANAPSSVRAVFCPPTVYLESALAGLPQNAQLQLGAQDCHAAASGAYTGDVSAAMLADVGANFVIVGHSERRQYHQESNAQVADKVAAAQAAGLRPILCVGESASEYEAGQTGDILKKQLSVWQGKKVDFMVAYEPVWAIGTGKTPNSKEIDAAHRVIKSLLGSETIVLYGGSVKPANIAEILSIETVHGALIGGASLQAADMKAMIGAVNK